MLMVLPRWKASVYFEDGESVTVWMDDNFLSSVLRKVADLQFSESGLRQPTWVRIDIVRASNSTTGTVSFNAEPVSA